MLGFSRVTHPVGPRFFALVSALAALTLQAGCTCGAGPYEGDYFDGDRPAELKAVKFKESEKGDPKVIGCADGQREGFADIKTNPRVAGCVGSWEKSKSLRDEPTGKACGDDGEKCAVPADVCAEGWHVCGYDGNITHLTDRVAVNECHNAGPGRFNAALSHSPTDEIDPCPVIRPNTPLPCIQAGIGAEPVCCGNDCLYGACKDGVWKEKTKISRGTSEGCGAVTSDHNGGLLCCFDGDGDPSALAAGGADETGADADTDTDAQADAKVEGDAKADEADKKGADKATKKATGKTPEDKAG